MGFCVDTGSKHPRLHEIRSTLSDMQDIFVMHIVCYNPPQLDDKDDKGEALCHCHL